MLKWKFMRYIENIIESEGFFTETFELHGLKHIKTLTVNDFKKLLGIDKIDVKKHPKGFLFFSCREIVGLVSLARLPRNPRISIVIGKLGFPFYLLHEADDVKNFGINGVSIDINCGINKNLNKIRTNGSIKQIDYSTKILVNRLHYDINNDDRFLLPFVQNAKIGFVNKEAEIIIPASYRFVLDDFYHEKSLVRVGETYGVAFERKTSTPAVYLRERYGLLKTNGELLLPIEYEGIVMPIFSNRIVLRSYEKGYAVIDFNGNIIVPFGKYNYIDGFDRGVARVKQGKTTNGLQKSDAKWGIIDENGNEVLEPIYNNIWNFYNKALQYTRVESDEKIFEFHFSNRQLMPNGYQREKVDEIQRKMDNYRALQEYRESTYEEYNGSYAQDVMGYSDQAIDDAFDGDPDAYWNID